MQSKYMYPTYYKKFECIGSSCEDTCCKNWHISIDRDTYKKYKKLRKKSFNPFDDEKIVLGKNKYNFNLYAYFNTYKYQGSCPFLNENLLCDIYGQFGKNNLPFTCKVYPRSISHPDEFLEIALTLSCPEVARLAILDENPMKFETSEKIFDSAVQIFEDNLGEIKPYSMQNDPLKKLFWDIRIPSITILQSRNLNINSRITLLGILYNKILYCAKSNNYDLILPQINQIMRICETATSQDLKPESDINVRTKLVYYKEIIKHVLSFTQNSTSKVLPKILLSVDENFIQEAAKKDQDFDEFVNGYFSVINEFLDQNATMIENYLVNEFFRLSMPFGSFETIWDSIVLLCVNLSIIKIMLIHSLIESKTLDRSALLYCIQRMSRGLMHSTNYTTFSNDLVKKLKINTLGGLYTIIY